MKQIIFGRINTRGGDFGNDGSGATAYTSLRCTEWTDRFQATAEADATAPWSVDGSFTNLYVSLDTPGGSNSGLYVGWLDSSATYTLRVNGADTGLSVTIASGQQSAPISAASVAVHPGDRLTWVRRSSATLARLQFFDVHISCTFVSTNVGESGWNSTNSEAPSSLDGSTTYYICPWGTNSQITWTNSSTDVFSFDTVMAAGSLTRLDIRLQTAPGGATSRSFYIVKNGTQQDGTGGTVNTTVTISGAATTGSSTFTLPLVATDTIALKQIPASSPAATKAAFSTAFKATVDGQYNLCTNVANAVPSASVADYANFAQNNGWAQTSYTALFTEANMQAIPGADPWTVTGIFVQLPTSSGGPGTSKSYAFISRLNALSVGPTVTLTGSAINGQSNVGTFSTAGVKDRLAFQATPTGTPTQNHVAWTYLVVGPTNPTTTITSSPYAPAAGQWRLHRFDLKPTDQERA